MSEQQDGPAVAQPATPSGGDTRGLGRGLLRRYKDAYLVARATNAIGYWLKALGFVIGLGILLGVPYLLGERLLPMGFLIGIPIMVYGFVIGVLVAAQGQILMANLDAAVNSSPHLTLDEKARIMSLDLDDGDPYQNEGPSDV
jgi:hypothetical protein